MVHSNGVSQYHTGGKLDVGRADSYASVALNDFRVSGDRNHDQYGRVNVHDNSLFKISHGNADSAMCGLIDHETTLRPPYWASIGGDCSTDRPGLAQGNGQPGRPNLKTNCGDQYANGMIDCGQISDPNLRQDCDNANSSMYVSNTRLVK
jgi:hypothetical protein